MTHTTGDLMVAYEKSFEYRTLTPKTKDSVALAFKRLAPFKDREPDTLTKAEMLELVDTLPPGVAHIFISRVRALFSWARSREMMTGDPLSTAKAPPSGEYRPWDQKEVDTFLKKATPQVRMAVQLAYYTGQRMGDVLNMKWDDIDDNTIFLVQQKTKSPLAIPLHPKLRTALRTHRRRFKGKTIISNTRGEQYDRDSFGALFRRERDRLGLPKDLVFHGLRKLTAVSLAEKGASTQEIMAVGGWKTSKMVDHYCKGASQRALAQSAIDKLGAL